MPVTIRDIARELGISHSTVSRVLSGRSEAISERTRTRVKEAAQRLGDRPNRSATALVTGHTNTVGLLVHDMPTNPFFARLITTVHRETRALGYHTLVSFVDAEDSDFAQAALELEARQVEGLLVYPGGAEQLRAYLQARSVQSPPLVLLGCAGAPGLQVVTADEEEGGYRITRHLLDLGHRRIALLGAYPPLDPELRGGGYERAMHEGGLYPRVLDCHADLGAARQRAAAVLREPEPPTAIFAWNDYAALGVLQAAAEAGLRVPEDLSVAGFDDIEMAAAACPALTTAHFPVEEMVHLALLRLRGQLGRPSLEMSYHETVLKVSLRLRQSSGPAPAAVRGEEVPDQVRARG